MDSEFPATDHIGTNSLGFPLFQKNAETANNFGSVIACSSYKSGYANWVQN
jgi:hypothetical protein